MTKQTQALLVNPANMQGTASRIPAVAAKPAILRATIQVTRAATGKVEEFEIVGTQAEEPKKD